MTQTYGQHLNEMIAREGQPAKYIKIEDINGSYNHGMTSLVSKKRSENGKTVFTVHDRGALVGIFYTLEEAEELHKIVKQRIGTDTK